MRALDAEPRSVLRARRFVASTLQGWGYHEVTDTACLLTSELVTNAIVHAGTEVDVSVNRSDRHVRVEVRDHAGGTVRPRPASKGPNGRGLRLVASMSEAWGVERTGHGKAVWFSLPA